MPSYTIFLMNDHKQARQTQIHTHDLDNFQDSFSGCIFNFFFISVNFHQQGQEKFGTFFEIGTDKNQNFPIFDGAVDIFNKRYKKVNVHS